MRPKGKFVQIKNEDVCVLLWLWVHNGNVWKVFVQQNWIIIICLVVLLSLSLAPSWTHRRWKDGRRIELMRFIVCDTNATSNERIWWNLLFGYQLANVNVIPMTRSQRMCYTLEYLVNFLSTSNTFIIAVLNNTQIARSRCMSTWVCCCCVRNATNPYEWITVRLCACVLHTQTQFS